MTEVPAELIVEVLARPEGGFAARAHKKAIVIQSETLEGLEPAVRDALRSHLKIGRAPGLIRLQS